MIAAGAVSRVFDRHANARTIAGRGASLRTLAESVVRPGEIGRQWVRALELTLFFYSAEEAASRLGLHAQAELADHYEHFTALVETLSHLDLPRVFRENAEYFEAQSAPPADAALGEVTEDHLGAVRTLLEQCPIEKLESAGPDIAAPDVANRCRLAYDGLQAFIVRHTQPGSDALRTAGHLYAEGRASIHEVASLLSMSVPDVVAALEASGFRRSVDKLVLGDEDRTRKLASIRKDRLARGGAPAASAESVAREVIASQRIEGIDARPWSRW